MELEVVLYYHSEEFCCCFLFEMGVVEREFDWCVVVGVEGGVGCFGFIRD